MKKNSNKLVVILSMFIGLIAFSSFAHAVRLTGTCPSGHTMDMGKMNTGQNSKADTECSSCHGVDGNGVKADDNVPRLAGQDFMYMCAWLDDCRSKGKACESHEDIATNLSDADIVGLAMFYTHSAVKKLPNTENNTKKDVVNPNTQQESTTSTPIKLVKPVKRLKHKKHTKHRKGSASSSKKLHRGHSL